MALSAGWELYPQTTFLADGFDENGAAYPYRQVDINPGLLYERIFSGRCHIAFRGLHQHRSSVNPSRRKKNQVLLLTCPEKPGIFLSTTTSRLLDTAAH
jgi:hypothetical protein